MVFALVPIVAKDRNADRQDDAEKHRVFDECGTFFVLGEFQQIVQKLTHGIRLQNWMWTKTTI